MRREKEKSRLEENLVTVKELIKQLETMPQDVKVIFWHELPETWYSTKSCEISVNPYTGCVNFEI